jgi:hypothetical protein
MRLASIACLLLLAGAVEGSAHADTPVGRPDIQVGLALGLGLPGGDLGVDAQLGVADAITIGAGAGLDLSGNLQGYVMPRLRSPGERIDVELGAGVAAGHYEAWCFLDCDKKEEGFAEWAMIEPSLVVHPSTTPIYIRLFGGYKWMLDKDRVCSTHTCPNTPYLGASVGTRF